MPTPRGEVAVAYRREGTRLHAEITLPAGLAGRFVWKGQERPLGPGTTRHAAE